MTDTTEGAAPPKKRSFFKRAAWQDAPKKDDEDIFSHASEFKNIIAEQAKREEEKRRKAQEERRRRQDVQSERKRRKVSGEHEEPAQTRSGSGHSSSGRATRTSNKARSRTPLSPAPSKPPPDSLAGRYDSLTKNTISNGNHIIDLGGSSDADDDDDSGYKPAPLDDPSWPEYDIPVRLPHDNKSPAVDEDEDDDLDPTLAALTANARANKARAAALPSNGVVEIFISSEIPNTKPLLAKVRISSTLQNARTAWCAKQGFTPAVAKDIFFTWKGQRMYDSTTVKRLGIEVDAHGNVSVEGDTRIYDEQNLPKVSIEAWTSQLHEVHKKEQAAAAAARNKAAQPWPEPELREPTPEPEPTVKRCRLIMKAKGKADFRIDVYPDTTFVHVASAFKESRGIGSDQPITLMFDGDRLQPLWTVADTELEDMDAIDVIMDKPAAR